MTEIVVWVSEPSEVCARVKALLDKRGYEYRSIQVSTAEDREQMMAATGMKSCPLVYVGETLIGGLSETLEADRSGRLEQMLAA